MARWFCAIKQLRRDIDDEGEGFTADNIPYWRKTILFAITTYEMTKHSKSDCACISFALLTDSHWNK